ncbi:MAG: hypothetical protein HMLKMBBP_01273 [Planctomycetes bacterium]|nr:hypothetical protein [Planctomycetota bacterium]
MVVLPDESPPHTAGAGTGAKDLGEVWLKSDWLYVTKVVAVDEEGTPVPNPEIRLFGGGNCDTAPAIVMHGDAEGRATVTHRLGGFLVTAPGRSFVWAGTGTEQTTETVTLPRGYDIRGDVVDDQGRPVAGADITLESGSVNRRVRTDTGGGFRFELVAVSDAAFGWVVKDGARRPWSASSGDERVRITLARPVVVEGTVVLADGSAAARAQVVTQGRFNNNGAATANERGEFRVVVNSGDGLRLHARTYRTLEQGLMVWSEGSAEVAAEPGAHVHDVRIALAERAHSFARLRATTADGVPLDDVYVTARPAGSYSQAPTGDGLLCLVDAPPGTEIVAQVHARHATFARSEVRVVTTAEPTSPAVDVPLKALAPVRLHLTDADGRDVPSSEWTDFSVNHGGVSIRDDRSLAVTPGLEFNVRITARGRTLVQDVVAPGGDSREIALRFPPVARVRGRLVRKDGATTAGFRVRIFPDAASDGRIAAGAVTSADGSFVVRDAPVGDVVVVGQAGDSSASLTVLVRRLRLDPAPDIDLGEMIAWGTVAAVGRVESPDGDSMVGASARIDWGDRFGGGSAICALDGTFRMTAAAVADALVTVRRPGRLVGITVVDLAQSAEFRVPMRRVGVLRLSVPYERPLDDVVLEGEDPRLRWRPGSWGRSSDESWTDIEDAPEGTWTLVVTGKGTPEWRGTVTIRAGETTLVQIDR